MTKEMAIDAWKKALEHKKEAGLKFEKWLQEKGILFALECNGAVFLYISYIKC